MRTQQQTRVPAPLTPQGLQLGDHVVSVDDEGYLFDSSDWSPEVAETMAANDDVALNADHWIAINFLRDFYAQFGVAPQLDLMQRRLCKNQRDCRWNREFIRQLFPTHGAKDACRYAGLPKPPAGACG